MSEYAIGLKIGATALVLRLLEEGGLDGIPRLSSPVKDIKRISRDLNSPLATEGRKRRYTALDIQSIYLEKAQRFLASQKASREEKRILKIWGDTLLGLRKVVLSSKTGEIKEDPEGLRRRIDWLLKHWLLNRYREKYGLDWHDARLKSLDLKYHDLDPETGLFDRCQLLDLVDRMLEDTEICRAHIDPPRGTRAWTRGMIIRNTMDKNVEVHVKDWERIYIKARRSPGRIHSFDRHRRMANALGIKLEDPLEAENPSVLKEVKQFVEQWG
jgi:proteasome accessory factor A